MTFALLLSLRPLRLTLLVSALRRRRALCLSLALGLGLGLAHQRLPALLLLLAPALLLRREQRGLLRRERRLLLGLPCLEPLLLLEALTLLLPLRLRLRVPPLLLSLAVAFQRPFLGHRSLARREIARRALLLECHEDRPLA